MDELWPNDDPEFKDAAVSDIFTEEYLQEYMKIVDKRSGKTSKRDTVAEETGLVVLDDRAADHPSATSTDLVPLVHRRNPELSAQRVGACSFRGLTEGLLTSRSGYSFCTCLSPSSDARTHKSLMFLTASHLGLSSFWGYAALRDLPGMPQSACSNAAWLSSISTACRQLMHAAAHTS